MGGSQTQYVLPISEVTKKRIYSAGGKGASLGEIMHTGLNVPEGFVVTAQAFDEVLQDNSLTYFIKETLQTCDAEEIHTLENASEIIQGAIMNCRLQAVLEDTIKHNFLELGASHVAVRSSATVEDGKTSAWAGQLETFLGVTEDTLIESIKHCWASLYSPRAIFYAISQGFLNTSVSVAVVIQRLIDSDTAGIAFSVHPVTQNTQHILIEAGLGQGEAVVSGSITPDSYVLDKDSEKATILSTTISSQEKMLVRKEDSLEWQEIVPHYSKQKLTDKQLRELHKAVITLENHFAFPVDVEWAFANETLYITQARPITTLAKKRSISHDSYVFMWETGPFMPSYLATPRALTERNDIYPLCRLETYFDGKKCTAYLSEKDIEMLKHTTGPLFLDEAYYRGYILRFEKEFAQWNSFIRRVETSDYSSVSNEALVDDLKLYFEYMRDSIAYFGSTRPEFTFAAEEKLRTILKEQFPQSWHEAFFTLITPTEEDDIQREQREWQTVSHDDVSVAKHLSKFPWLVFGEFDEQKAAEFLKNRPLSETPEVERFRKLQNAQASILSELQDAREAQYLAHFLQEQALRRSLIKSYWMGSLYHARKLWLEIAGRLSLHIWDVLSYLTDTDIVSGLLEGTSLSSIIERRKTGYFITIQNESVVVIDGEKAHDFFHDTIRISVEKDAEIITGQVANPGYYKGKVRKVSVGDLSTLEASLKEFQKGEIVVTTMTQPNMMVLAQKAGAIITDEGGITSHAAIIARELGIPCVVGCLHAMTSLEDGEEVIVDAGEGKIVRLSKKATK